MLLIQDIMSKFKPIKTADITWIDGLPYAAHYADIYFSAHNGLDESRHVFIDGNDLEVRWQQLHNKTSSQFVIGETGFGTGLNFLQAWSTWDRVAPRDARLHFLTCEQHPLSLTDLQKCLSLWPKLGKYAHALLAAYPVLTPGYHRLEFDEGRVVLTLMLGDALRCYQDMLVCGEPKLEAVLQARGVDAWFLDGFSPQKNPKMWSVELLRVLSLLSRKGTTLSTFSVAGSVKHGLQEAGFKISKRCGHGRKREMLVAQWQQPPSNVLKGKTPWHVGLPHNIEDKHAIIVGAGLAGCCMAYALSTRGWRVTILDSQGEVASGASGNQQAVLFPNLSAHMAPLTDFMLSAFLYAHRFYQRCLAQWPIGELSGILQFENKQRTQLLEQWLEAYPALGRFVDDREATALSGVSTQHHAVFIPLSGWINIPELCSHLLQHSGIEFIAHTHVNALEFKQGQWSVAGHQAPVVILANGEKANQLLQTQHLHIEPVRGQMTTIPTNQRSTALKIPLCGQGHILPPQNGHHAVGATFGRGLDDVGCYITDDTLNIASINSLPLHFDFQNEVLTHWAGIRAGTLDHLPLVGPVADSVLWTRRFGELSLDTNRWVPYGGDVVQGLYICSGFGSRGLTTVPLSVDSLASYIHHEPSPLPRHLAQAISPARFLYREVIKTSPNIPLMF